jgi:flagellar hook-associated protein 1 FlgK
VSLSELFNIANSALNASQAGLSVTSNNIANANTPGYSRQDIVVSITSPTDMGRGYMGMGVSVTGVRSSSNRFIQAQLLDQEQNAGKSNTMEQMLSQVEQIFNEAQNMGISTPLTNYFNAWNDVASDPTSQTARTVLLQKAGTLVVSAQRMENSILQNLNQASTGVDDAVKQINSIATQIAAMNGQIVKVEAGHTGARANDLRDQRDQLMNELSNLVGNTSYEDQDGALTVAVGMKNLVAGTKTNTLSTALDQNGNKQLMLDNTNITAQVDNGQIGGLLASGNEIQSNSLFGLRKLIASVTKEINLLHESGYGLDGSTNNDFFTSLQLSTENYSASANITASIADLSQLNLDEYTIGFAAGNYTVTDKQTGVVAASGVYVSGNTIAFDGIQVSITGAVTSADSFTISPLTDAIKKFGVAISDSNKVAASSSATELPGNNAVALQIARASGAAVADLGSGTFSEYYQGLVSGIGSLSQAASDGSTFDQNLLSQITKQRDSISGVSLDEEAANLIKYQRAYEAGAKMIQITDELLQAVINL